ncbi:hypothetical protein N7454_005242 [Penicillium verhagenii]|nr:hypothetical protein N7454_005242 [Penicillium verhagenii]
MSVNQLFPLLINSKASAVDYRRQGIPMGGIKEDAPYDWISRPVYEEKLLPLRNTDIPAKCNMAPLQCVAE